MEGLAELGYPLSQTHEISMYTGNKRSESDFYKQGTSLEHTFGEESVLQTSVVTHAYGNKVSEKARFWSSLSPFLYLFLYATL